jgi:hypothetical protein
MNSFVIAMSVTCKNIVMSNLLFDSAGTSNIGVNYTDRTSRERVTVTYPVLNRGRSWQARSEGIWQSAKLRLKLLRIPVLNDWGVEARHAPECILRERVKIRKQAY